MIEERGNERAETNEFLLTASIIYDFLSIEVLSHATFMLQTQLVMSMDSTSPVASRIAGQTSHDSGTLFTRKFAMAFLTLVENTFVGRRCDIGCDSGHRRYRDHHHRLADGYGHAS